MGICAGCGGVLGRDCWNEQDCVAISRQIQLQEGQQETYMRIMHQPLWKSIKEIIEFKIAYSKQLESEEPDQNPF